jgi:putative two-component system response regulator
MLDLTSAKIMIVDDEIANVRLLERILEKANYTNLFSVTDSMKAVDQFDEVRPDILLLDLNMPRMDGMSILNMLTPEVRGSVPIIVLSADATTISRHKALDAGADDFVTKPFEEAEVRLRIRNLLRSRFSSVYLEETVQRRTLELKTAQTETVRRLARAAEYRDDDTGRHAERVGQMSGQIAQSMGRAPSDVGLLIQAAQLHDVGKIGIPDSILLKPSKLSDEEFSIMKEHTKIGARILSGSTYPVLIVAESIALNHHERWDGSGYWNVIGSSIPLEGRIVAVADTFDAMTQDRPYRKALPLEVAVSEIKAQRNRQFDPAVVDAFLRIVEGMLRDKQQI